MAYLIVATVMNEFEWQQAASLEQACELGEAMFRRASNIMILDQDLTAWSVDSLREALAAQDA
jgi:hypothetical protein